MSELPGFEERFRQYSFEWKTRALGKYSKVLIREFYTAYKGKLQSQHLQVQSWKGGEPIKSLLIRGVWVDISP